MGVEIVDCPVCGQEARVGIPHGSELLGVSETGEHRTTEESKTRLITCSAGHGVWVEFTI